MGNEMERQRLCPRLFLLHHEDENGRCYKQHVWRLPVSTSAPLHGHGSHDNMVKCSSAMMRDKGLSLYWNVCILVGDAFCLRVNLCVVGLHRTLQPCIDYIITAGWSIVTCVVSTGIYLNGEDNGDVLLYTSHGGNCVGNHTWAHG